MQALNPVAHHRRLPFTSAAATAATEPLPNPLLYYHPHLLIPLATSQKIVHNDIADF